MKKFFANLVVFLSVVLITAVIVPWNDLSQWGLGSLTVLSDNELMIKGGIGALMFVFGLIFLIVSIVEYNNEGSLSTSTANAAFLPMWMFAAAATGYAVILALFNYSWPANAALPNDIYLYAVGFFALNVIGFGHILSSGFRLRKNFSRVMIFVFLLELLAAGGGAGYFFRTQTMSDAHYAGLNTSLYLYAAGGAILLFYIAHIIILAVKRSRYSPEELLAIEASEPQSRMADEPRLSSPEKAPAPVKEKAKPKKRGKEEDVPAIDPRKTLIVSKNEAIRSKGQSIDPTTVLYEDISIDPEFTQTANQARQVNSIDYYIEKPKMFKPLDPTFDLLVEYVRELPNVVTKIADEKITFYLDRNPFLVLVNYGNYYRMAFRYELEKGIRLIIKYPTISKNKSTKDDLWFKANNYGDLPKEVIYQIVKSSYDQATN